MFGVLSEKLSGIFVSMIGKKKISEENISDAIREVRLALLEADVNYTVTKNLIKRVKEKALGDEVIASVTKILHDELAALMGGGEAKLELKGRPAVIMLCGLQGSGKTTQAAKLAHFLKGKKVALAACDLARPAAVEQLKTLGSSIGVRVYAIEGEKSAEKVALEAVKLATRENVDVLILDTAGRLHIDEPLMDELARIKKSVKPCEVLFVANAATGQDAVNTAKSFEDRLGITGSILTMLDGDTRGGAAISIREVTGKPLKFEGVGERIEDLQIFNADSMADRILGMGDTINLVKKAKEHISEEEAADMEEKMRKASFTYEDYLKQIQALRKMGSFSKLMKMVPGASKFPDFADKEKEFFKIEAIILSMTPRERREQDELTMSRLKRLAKGSGSKLSDVHKLKKSFKGSKQFFKSGANKKRLEKMMGGM